jgi:hypothetical protein
MRNFEHSVNVLVQAYLNDTLEHLNCCACAVGNLVADACGYTYKKSTSRYIKVEWDNGINAAWFDHLLGDMFTTNDTNVLGLKQIQSTGYSVEEIDKIERAFESAREEGDRMFEGLCQVVDVLADIHQVDLKQREEAKAMFIK